MALLALGVLLWSAAHLVPSVAVATRGRWIEKLGEQKYKGLFALTIVASLALIIVGWRAAPYVHVYAPPAWGVWATEASMLVSLWLFLGVGSPAPSNVKRFLRHPQLTGVALWAASHLAANGDARSLVLFGGIGAWAIASMASINRRDGAWKKPRAVPLSKEVRPVLVAVIAYVALFLLHGYFTAVALPRPF